jgi:hypothetical protein
MGEDRLVPMRTRRVDFAQRVNATSRSTANAVRKVIEWIQEFLHGKQSWLHRQLGQYFLSPCPELAA